MVCSCSKFEKDDKADLLVQIQMYLSFFTLARVVELAKKVNRKRFESIVTPCDLGRVCKQVYGVKEFLPNLVYKYIPFVGHIPLAQGLVWTPTWKALPTYGDLFYCLNEIAKNEGGPIVKKVESIRSCFLSLHLEIASFVKLNIFVHSRGEQWSQGTLWSQRTRYALDPNNKKFSGTDLDEYETLVGPYFHTYWNPPLDLTLGRLGQTCEGGLKGGYSPNGLGLKT